MSGGEILAALAVIAAAADTVTKVFDALHAGKDFIDSFSGKKDYSRELQDSIEQAKREIEAGQLQAYMNTINGASLWYYKCQKTIQEFGISRCTVGDSHGELYLFSQDILRINGSLDEMKKWMDTDISPRPCTAKMLGVYLAYYGIRHSLLVTYEAFEFARTGHNSATFGDLVQDLNDAQDVLNKRFEAYQSVRASQLLLVRHRIPGDPPSSGPLVVREDHGGDTLIPNIPTGTRFDDGASYNAYKIIHEAWKSTEFGKTTIPNLFKTYEGAYKGGLSLVQPRHLGRIEVFDHFIIGAQN